MKDLAKDLIKKIITRVVDDIAQRYGIKNKKRVRAIMERTATDHLGRPLANDVDVENFSDNGLGFRPHLEEALYYLPPKEALTAFESIDPRLFSRRLSLVEYFADPLTPFYTLKELTELAEKFRTHLECNRDLLIKVGFPKTSFEESKWFDYHLSPLSFVKLPISLHWKSSPIIQRRMESDGLVEKDAKGNLIYHYSWVDRCPLSEGLRWEQSGPEIVKRNGSSYQVIPLSFCEYEKASLIKGLSSKTAHKLEHGRLKFFKVKIDIINTILDCLWSPEGRKTIWEKCLTVLSAVLKQEEMKFYIEVDSTYDRLGVGDYLDMLYGRAYRMKLWGGMNNLISIIGHFEKEIDIGTFDKTKKKLLDQLNDIHNLQSYYQVIGNPIQPGIDAALDSYGQLEKKEKGFWERFQRRVNMAVQREFDVDITIKKRVKSKYAGDYKVVIQSFADWQSVMLNKTGKLVPVEGSLRVGTILTVPTDKQTEDYKKFGYKCHDRVHIPGSIPMKRSNLIVVNGHKIKLADSLFILLLRLVVELKKSKEGWVFIQDLYSEGIISDPDKYQIYSRLRTALAGSLLDKEDGQKFIEKGGFGRYRISTHPDFITWDKKELLKNPADLIQKLVKELPNAPEV